MSNICGTHTSIKWLAAYDNRRILGNSHLEFLRMRRTFHELDANIAAFKSFGKLTGNYRSCRLRTDRNNSNC